jgi:L-amino acid N-acyltransferase YncA/predicted O-methyltransferase YrrM
VTSHRTTSYRTHQKEPGVTTAAPLDTQRTTNGVAYRIIDGALRDVPEYREFRAGTLSRAAYCAWLGSGALRPEQVGLNEDQFNLSSRFPVDERAFVAEVLEGLRRDGVVTRTDYPEDELEALRERVARQFAHDDRTTYIFPEEARLLFALGHLLAPRRTVFPGSYYGYWAVWALPGIQAAGGTATLIDIDPGAMALAERNLTALGLADGVEFATTDAIAHGRTLDPVDLCVLDAEGPAPHAAPEGMDPHLIDKAIYFPIMEATTPALRPGCLLIAHNMLLGNLTENRYFSGRIADNRAQYAHFQDHLDAHYDLQRLVDSSEGVGIYRRRADVVQRPSDVVLRPLSEADLPEVLATLNHAIRHTDATLDHEEKTLDDLRAWFTAHQGRYPALAAEQQGRFAGYGTLSPFSSRKGYLASAEISIYLSPDAQGRGVGSALCVRLTELAEQAGMSTVIAFISAGNEPSRRMVLRCGYRHEGVLRQVGYKLGRLVDLDIFQRGFPANCARYDGTPMHEVLATWTRTTTEETAR